jgi:outer membrane protein assembly factor BamB
VTSARARPGPRERLSSRPRPGRRLALLCLLGAALAGAAGAGCATERYHRAGNADDVAAALSRSRPAPGGPTNATGRPLVFLSFGGLRGPQIGAYDLAQAKLLWTQPGEVTGRIEVGRDAIVHARRAQDGRAAGQGELVGRDLLTGALLWQHPISPDERLLGYTVDADRAIYVVRSGEGPARGQASAVALDAVSGAVRWRHALPSGDAGAPAARGGLVAVPVQSQYVILLDGRTGDEAAQILSTEEAATFVRGMPEGIFFGSKGIFAASAATATASRRSPGYVQASLPKFVRPFYHHDMYRPEQGDYSAIDRNRILWRVGVDGAGRASFRDGMVFVHNYRFFFGFDAGSSALKWAYDQPDADAVSSDHTGGALVFVTTAGEIGALDAATGQRIYAAHVPGASLVRGATFDADGFAPRVGGTGDLPPARHEGLAETLSAILWDADRRFWDVKIFAIDELGKLPGRGVTADLLKVTQQQDLPVGVRRKAGEALVARKDGNSIDLFIETLKTHSDFVEGTRASSVEIVARAAGAMKAKAVAGALIEHLRLPDTEPETVTQISRALAAIQATEGVPALRDFLSLYRADPAYDAEPAALIAVSEALLQLGGAGERPLLLFIAEQPSTIEPLRLHIRQALAQTAAAVPVVPPTTTTSR